MINNQKVIFNLATMPQRINSLSETMLSILHQADEVNVYLNEFAEVPDFLYHPKINYFKSQEEAGDLGDVGKFYRAGTEKGYIFLADDDIIYPRTYAADMVRHIERFGKKAVVSCHGRILPDRTIKSYYKDYQEVFPCLETHREGFIHVGGTGVAAFHSSTLTPKLKMFETSNMADIWFSIALQKKAIPVFCPAVRKGYLHDAKGYDHNYTIAKFCAGNDAFQTNAVNSISPWKLHSL